MGIDKPIPQFKVWDNEKKKFITDDNSIITMTNKGKIIVIQQEFTSFDFLHDAKICRFTDLFDKNNVPIYENDVFKYTLPHRTHFYIVKFGRFVEECIPSDFWGIGFYLQNLLDEECQESITCLEGCSSDSYELLGNALSNPELLEAKE